MDTVEKREEDIADDVISYLVNNVPINKSVGKLAEELAELSEVLLKIMTDRRSIEESKAKIIEELGDILFRSAVVIKQMDIEQAVEERILEKAIYIQGKIAEGYFDKWKEKWKAELNK